MPGESVQRVETRYLVEDAAAIVSELASRNFARSVYRIRTLYLPGVGRSRLRLREYDGSGVLWLEHKLRRGDLIRKIRHRLGPVDLRELQASAVVTYRRHAYELEGIRVTIDDELRHGDTSFDRVVVEVKGGRPGEELGIGLPDPDPTFSKFSWAVGRYEGAAQR